MIEICTEEEARRLIYEYSKRGMNIGFDELCKKDNFFENAYRTGIERIRNTNLANAKDRLEVILEQHPEIQEERIAFPKEIHALTYAFNKAGFRVDIKNTLTLIGFTGIFSSLWYFGIKNVSQDQNILLRFLPWFSLLLGVDFAGHVLKSAGKTIKSTSGYLKNKIFRYPLSEQEKRFADYVYSSDKN